jgi:dTDP-4-dehydrorhamnose reductase
VSAGRKSTEWQVQNSIRIETCDDKPATGSLHQVLHRTFSRFELAKDILPKIQAATRQTKRIPDTLTALGAGRNICKNTKRAVT